MGEAKTIMIIINYYHNKVNGGESNRHYTGGIPLCVNVTRGSPNRHHVFDNANTKMVLNVYFVLHLFVQNPWQMGTCT